MAAKKERLTTREVIENAERIFHEIRWNYGIVVCPYCDSIHIKQYDGYKYKCNSCKNRFSDKTNTLMHGSKLSVKVWMQAMLPHPTTAINRYLLDMLFCCEQFCIPISL